MGKNEFTQKAARHYARRTGPLEQRLREEAGKAQGNKTRELLLEARALIHVLASRCDLLRQMIDG